MPRPRRRTIGLLVLVLLASFAIRQRVAPWLRSVTWDAPSTTRVSVSATPTARVPVRRLALDRLRPEARSLRPGRDLFRFAHWQDRNARQQDIGPTDPPDRLDTTPRHRATPVPAKTLALLGIFGTRDRPIAVLTDGDTTFNALVNDQLVDGRRIEAIGVDPRDDQPVVVLRRGPTPGAPAITLRVNERG